MDHKTLPKPGFRIREEQGGIKRPLSTTGMVGQSTEIGMVGKGPGLRNKVSLRGLLDILKERFSGHYDIPV